MKQILTFLIVASLAFTIQAQDITNKLAADGNFLIKNSSDVSLFDINSESTGIHKLRLSSTDAIGFQILGSTGTPVFSIGDPGGFSALETILIGEATTNWLTSSFNHLQIQSTSAENNFAMVARANQNNILVYRANGTDGATNLSDNDNILSIHTYGKTNSGLYHGAGIDFNVDGSIGGDNPPVEINFLTSPGGNNAPTSRLLIRADGTINMAALQATSGGGASGDKPVYINSSGNLVAGTAVSKSYSYENIISKIEVLESENITLKAELTELRSMIEMLMKEK